VAEEFLIKGTENLGQAPPIRLRHRSAKHDRINEGSAIDVFNDIGKSRPNQEFANEVL
jgi:hypothetical protein